MSDKRKHLRVKIAGDMIFSADNNVFKVKMVNISEGGVLISDIPYFPEHDVCAYLEIPKIPKLYKFSDNQLNYYHPNLTPIDVVSSKIEILRRTGEVDDYFMDVAGKFTSMSNKDSELIAGHVIGFAENLVYLVTELQNSNNSPRIKKIAKLIGIGEFGSYDELKTEVEQLYSSLNW